MTLSTEFLRVLSTLADRPREPVMVQWPMPGSLGGFVSFASFNEWRDFVLAFSLNRPVPTIVLEKFERAQKLYLLAWIDFDLVKAGELVALTALELALTDRYGGKVRDKNGKIYFSRLLSHVPKRDGLTDANFAMNVRCGGGSVVDLLTGKRNPSLATIRNELAHGYPFSSAPWAGLLELVRDLIDHAYRRWPSDHL